MMLQEHILKGRQPEVLQAVASVATRFGFYLAGGTAIALRLGHRRSEDFDWFTDAAAFPSEPLLAALRAAVNIEVGTLEAGTIIGRVHGVKVSFLQFPYPFLAAPDEVEKWDLRLAHARDLAAMKLLAVTQRGARKDFIDIYELLRQGGDLRTMLTDYQTKFTVGSAISALRALVYFDDAEREPVPEMLVPLAWPELKNQLRAAVSRFME